MPDVGIGQTMNAKPGKGVQGLAIWKHWLYRWNLRCD